MRQSLPLPFLFHGRGALLGAEFALESVQSFLGFFRVKRIGIILCVAAVIDPIEQRQVVAPIDLRLVAITGHCFERQSHDRQLDRARRGRNRIRAKVAWIEIPDVSARVRVGGAGPPARLFHVQVSVIVSRQRQRATDPFGTPHVDNQRIELNEFIVCGDRKLADARLRINQQAGAAAGLVFGLVQPRQEFIATPQIGRIEILRPDPECLFEFSSVHSRS